MQRNLNQNPQHQNISYNIKSSTISSTNSNSLLSNDMNNLSLSKNFNEFDCTSIASASEISHWSGGNADDLDNIALVNGAENALEDKDWSTYLRLSKNTYNSSDDEDDDNDIHNKNDDDDDDDDDDATGNNDTDDEDEDNSDCNATFDVTGSLNTNDKYEYLNKMMQKKKKQKHKCVKKEKSVNDENTENTEEGRSENSFNLKLNKSETLNRNTNDFDDSYDSDSDDEGDKSNDDDDFNNGDLWTITPKLMKYYEKQFKTMQPNINGYITGSVARPFFEKSKLPLNELSRIWELADTNSTGALTFSQFCIAMHLVVLRVRNFDLPDKLPTKFQPYAPLIDFDSEPIQIKNETIKSGGMVLNEQIDKNQASIPSSIINTVTSTATIGAVAGANIVSPVLNSPITFIVNPQIPSDLGIVHPIALRVVNNQQSSYVTNINVKQQQPPLPPTRHSRSSSLGSITNRCQPPAVPPREHAQNDTIINESHMNLIGNNFPPPPLPPPPPPPPPPLPPPPPSLSSMHTASTILTQNQIENIIESIHCSNVEHKKKLWDRTKLNDYKKSQINDAIEKLKQLNENNTKLRRIFNDLEKEYRNLTDTRIALEIKYESLINESKDSVATTASVATTTTTTATTTAVTAVTTTSNITAPSAITNSKFI